MKKSFTFLKIWCFLVLSFMVWSASGQTVIYVDASVASGGGGGSWGAAFNDLNDAIAEAKTDPLVKEIWIAKGTYTAPSTGFEIVSGVKYYASLNAGAAYIEEQDTAGTPSVFRRLGGSTSPIFFGTDTEANTLVSGFVIDGTGGTMSGNGGAIQLTDDNINLSIKNCIFKFNRSNNYGGAVASVGSSQATTGKHLIIEDCKFYNNISSKGGGAIYNLYGKCEIRNCHFIGNGEKAQLSGGAIYAIATSSPSLIEKCYFQRNISASGGAIYLQNYTTQEARVENCKFYQNEADYGGAINLGNSTNSIVLNSIFAGNKATNEGGAIHSPLVTGGIKNFHFMNDVFFENDAAYGSIFSNVFDGADSGDGVSFFNSIFFANNNSYFKSINTSNAIVNIKTFYSLFQAGGIMYGDVIFDTGAVTGNPYFVDPNGVDNIAYNLDDNYRLLSTSDAIGKGTDYQKPGTWEGLESGLDGVEYGANDLVYDVGAYEYDQIVCNRFVVTKATDNFATGTATGECGDLRFAILEANKNPDLNTISFDIPNDAQINPHIIQLKSLLPTITQPLIIAGRTQAGFVSDSASEVTTSKIMIQIDGSGSFATGLNIQSSNVSVRGISVTGFTGQGINVQGTSTTHLSRVKVEGSYLGVNALETARPNETGISMSYCDDCIIGGTNKGDYNVISGNTAVGIDIKNTTNLRIIRNSIGVAPKGTACMANGIGIVTDTETNLHLGEDTTGRINTIACNSQNQTRLGILINVSIVNNNIGLGSGGANATVFGGAGNGLWLQNSTGVVGSANESFYNRIVGLDGNGLYFNHEQSIHILQNSIYKNAKGIDIALSDASEISAPAINSLSSSAITGTSDAGAKIQLYIDSVGQGQSYLGATTANTQGNWTFNLTATLKTKISAAAGLNLTATSTRDSGTDKETSEFSNPFRILTQAPTGLCVYATDGGFIANWNAVNGVTDYQLIVSRDSVDLKNATNPVATANTYTQAGLTNGERYFVAVTYNGGDTSNFVPVYPAQKAGQSVQLGGNNYATIPAGSQFTQALNAAGAKSFELWFKAPYGQGMQFFNAGSGSLVLGIDGSGDIYQVTNPATFNSTWDTKITDGNWHHLAWVYTGSAAELYLRLDNVPINNPAGIIIPNDFSINNNTFTIGEGTNNFGGEIDELRIWATSIDGVMVEQNINIPLLGNENKLIGLFHFDETLGTTETPAINSMCGMENAQWKLKTTQVSGAMNYQPCNPLIVTKTNDDNTCGTLRRAVNYANVNSNSSFQTQITLDLPKNSIILLDSTIDFFGQNVLVYAEPDSSIGLQVRDKNAFKAQLLNPLNSTEYEILLNVTKYRTDFKGLNIIDPATNPDKWLALAYTGGYGNLEQVNISGFGMGVLLQTSQHTIYNSSFRNNARSIQTLGAINDIEIQNNTFSGIAGTNHEGIYLRFNNAAVPANGDTMSVSITNNSFFNLDGYGISNEGGDTKNLLVSKNTFGLNGVQVAPVKYPINLGNISDSYISFNVIENGDFGISLTDTLLNVTTLANEIKNIINEGIKYVNVKPNAKFYLTENIISNTPVPISNTTANYIPIITSVDLTNNTVSVTFSSTQERIYDLEFFATQTHEADTFIYAYTTDEIGSGSTINFKIPNLNKLSFDSLTATATFSNNTSPLSTPFSLKPKSNCYGIVKTIDDFKDNIITPLTGVTASKNTANRTLQISVNANAPNLANAQFELTNPIDIRANKIMAIRLKSSDTTALAVQLSDGTKTTLVLDGLIASLGDTFKEYRVNFSASTNVDFAKITKILVFPAVGDNVDANTIQIDSIFFLPVLDLDLPAYTSACKENPTTTFSANSTNYTYNWTVVDETATTNFTTSDIDLSKSSFVKLEVTDPSTKCKASDHALFDVIDILVGINAKDNKTEICTGDSTILRPNVAIAYDSIQWFKTGSTTVISTADSLVVKQAGDYYFTKYKYKNKLINNDFCSNSSNIIKITQKTFAFSLGADVANVCASDTVISGPTIAGVNYRWIKNAAVLGTSNPLTVNQAGDYTLVIDSAGCVARDTIKVSGFHTPLKKEIASNILGNTLCPNSEVKIFAVQKDYASISWYKNGNNTSISTNDTLKTTQTGDYLYVKTATDGCKDSSQANVTVNLETPPANAPNFPASFQVCGTDTSLNNAYTWYNGNNTVALSNLTISTVGNYIAELTSVGTACKYRDTVSYAFGSSVSYSIGLTAKNTSGICSGNPITFDLVENVGNQSITWTASNGTIASKVLTLSTYSNNEQVIVSGSVNVCGTLKPIADTVVINTDTCNVNINPQALNDNVTTDEDNPVTISPLLNDIDNSNTVLSVSIQTQVKNGSGVVNTDKTINYTPNANFNGRDTLSYAITDGNGLKDTATIIITVNPVNDAPTLNPTTYTLSNVQQNSANNFSADILANAQDVDGDNLSFGLLFSRKGGTASANNGQISYSPLMNFSGKDTVDLQVCDNQTPSLCVSGFLYIDVLPLQNQKPVATAVNAVINEDQPATIDLTANISDADITDVLTITTLPESNTNGGTISVNDKTIFYTPAANFNGTDAFDYVVNDGKGGKDTAQVIITVNPVNDAPTLTGTLPNLTTDQNRTTAVSTTVDIRTLYNDIDAGTILSITNLVSSSNSIVSETNGIISYIPKAGFSGSDNITFDICDNASPQSCIIGTIMVTVTPITNTCPPLSISKSTGDICDNSVTLTATNLTGYTYQWFLNVDNNKIIGAEEFSYTALVDGEYFVRATNGTCDTTMSIDVVYGENTPQISGSPEITLANSGISHQWYVDVNGTLRAIVGADLNKYTPVFSGTYSCLVSYANCKLMSNSFVASTSNGAVHRAGLEMTDTEIWIPETAEPSLHIYPNPISDQHINLTYASFKDAEIQISLFDSDGKQVYSTTFTKTGYQNNLTIKDLNLKQGIYHLVLVQGDINISEKLLVY
jgi:hypothetical protein